MGRIIRPSIVWNQQPVFFCWPCKLVAFLCDAPFALLSTSCCLNRTHVLRLTAVASSWLLLSLPLPLLARFSSLSTTVTIITSRPPHRHIICSIRLPRLPSTVHWCRQAKNWSSRIAAPLCFGSFHRWFHLQHLQHLPCDCHLLRLCLPRLPHLTRRTRSVMVCHRFLRFLSLHQWAGWLRRLLILLRLRRLRRLLRLLRLLRLQRRNIRFSVQQCLDNRYPIHPSAGSRSCANPLSQIFITIIFN